MAMDEVAFDFLDALAPGCTVLFPPQDSVSFVSIIFIPKGCCSINYFPAYCSSDGSCNV